MKLIWLIVAILFAVAELMTTTLTLIWFSIGAVILIFLSSIIDSIDSNNNICNNFYINANHSY